MGNNKSNNQIISEVERAVSENRFDDALALLTDAIAKTPGSELYYMRGRLFWKIGRKGDAMSDYASATALDPSSPAAKAMEIARDVMDFYNKDLYNP